VRAYNSEVLFSSPPGGHFDVYAIDLDVPAGRGADKRLKEPFVDFD
jgi:hypothetical protein